MRVCTTRCRAGPNDRRLRAPALRTGDTIPVRPDRRAKLQWPQVPPGARGRPSPSMALERDQRMTVDALAVQEFEAPEIGEVDDECCAHDVATGAAQELGGCFRRA